MARKRKTNPVKEIPIRESKRAEQAMQQIRSLAAEFFDVGVILLSKEVEGHTEFLHSEFGNSFAVKGITQVFVNEILQDDMEPIDTDGDWEGEWADDEES
ncbi:hypothetical protein EBR03_04355 [bacterium]|nr:hypothetical protein [bacterium]